MAREFHLKNMWMDACENLGLHHNLDSFFDTVTRAYTDKSRKYHSLDHLAYCIHIASWFRHDFDYPNEAVIALFFHDVVYDTHDTESENVRRSASACETIMSELYKRSGKTPDLEVIERIKSYILATEHAEPPRNPDEALIMDIDLSYVASHMHTHEDVENWIRQEYHWVPQKVYSRARKDILIKLFHRDPIFYTPLMNTLLGRKMEMKLLKMIQMNGAKVAVGGTFDLFHVGHKKLIDTAFIFAGNLGRVDIGITSDKMASEKSHPVQPYSVRKRQIVDYINRKKYHAQYRFFPLDDPVGKIGTDPDYDVLVASTETGAGAEYVNTLRAMHGMNPVLVSLIDVVTDKTGQRISSTRLRDQNKR